MPLQPVFLHTYRLVESNPTALILFYFLLGVGKDQWELQQNIHRQHRSHQGEYTEQ